MKLSTINQIVEGILAEGEAKYEKEKDTWPSKELAMEYYFGNHSEDEYKEFRTSMVAPEDVNGKDL